VNNIEGTRQIDSVTLGEGVSKSYLKVIFWCYRIGGSDCLIKTQDFAKCINEV